MPGRTIWKWWSRLVIVAAEFASEAGVRELRQYGGEERQLRAVLLVVRRICTGQMAHDHLRLVANEVDHALDDGRFIQPEAQPVDAGVEMQGSGMRFVAGNTGLQPFLQHRDRAQARHQALAHIERGSAGVEAAQNEDVHIVGQRVAHRDAFIGRSDEKTQRAPA